MLQAQQDIANRLRHSVDVLQEKVKVLKDQLEQKEEALKNIQSVEVG